MKGKMECFGLSDIGKVRKINEDQFLIADLTKSMLIHQTTLAHEDHTRILGGFQGQLLLVADGMGGHAGGKEASTIAVETITRYVLNTMEWFFRLGEDEADLEDHLKAAVEECQKQIEIVVSSPSRHKMGTTLTMAYLLWPRLYVVHAGDSRCYLLRDNRLEQITVDHTMAQKLSEQGKLAADAVQQSRWSSMLWNCIGGGSHDLRVDVYKSQLQLGDTLLLCTDGLTGRVSDDRLAELLSEARTAEDTCRHLVNAAMDTDGRDNITVVVARFQDSKTTETQAEQHAVVENKIDPYSADRSTSRLLLERAD